MVAPFGNFYCITYPHKTTLSEANVKVNGMGGQNGPTTKHAILPVSTLFF